MRAGSNGKTLACASSFAAAHPSCDSAASMRRNGFVWVPTPGSAVLRTASPGVTHGAVSPRLVKLAPEPHGKARGGLTPASTWANDRSGQNSKSSKIFSKMRKRFKASNLHIGFLKIFHKKEDFGQ
jgi:hypothetical protein